jgi:hypothetical protein
MQGQPAQAADGHWSMHEINKHARTKPLPDGEVRPDNCAPGTTRKNDVAGTAFGLLPFLAAGHTQHPNKDAAVDYSKTVRAGLAYLKNKQDPKSGYFGADMYSHALAAIAMCEAYGLTADPSLKPSAQKAIDYIEFAQDPVGGGWRYEPRTPGDLSVTGWQLTALKSAQMAGLSVKASTFARAEAFLHSAEVKEDDNGKKVHGGGYGYMPGQQAPGTATTAIGLLCSMHLGVTPRAPGLRKGVAFLLQEKSGAYPFLPNRTKSLYYEYYATQVMHHVGGESWRLWNEGPDGKSGIRDTLIAKMDAGDKIAAQRGSWGREDDGAYREGGRIMSTSLSLLCLEVQDRHLPLYRRADDGDVGPAEISREVSRAKAGQPPPVSLKPMQ